MIDSQNNWDKYFFDIIQVISTKSKDPSTKVAAIIVSPNNEIVSTGFNGFPRGVEDNPEVVPERYIRETKYLYTSHAEQNSIFFAARRGIPVEGCKIYVEFMPCAECMKAIIQSGIIEIVLNGDSPTFNNKALYERWRNHFECSKTMASEAKIQIRVYKTNQNGV